MTDCQRDLFERDLVAAIILQARVCFINLVTFSLYFRVFWLSCEAPPNSTELKEESFVSNMQSLASFCFIAFYCTCCVIAEGKKE